MKKLILEYLANFSSRWDAANDERRTKLTSEYKSFCYVYGLPKLSVEDMVHDINRGLIDIEEEDEQEGLFGKPELWTPELKEVLDNWIEDELNYESIKVFLDEVRAVGYEFSYGLDAQPYNLRKIEEKALSSPAAAKEKWMNKLEESKNSPRKFQAHDTAWDFVEEYYPNYSSSDEICEANDLNLILERKNSIMDEEGTDLHQRYISEFDGQICAVMNRHDQLMKDIYEQAIENFIQSQNK